MNHIELFAGCGGLSLGLESEGFELILANELSPMAGETFAFNHLNLNLAEEWTPKSDKVYWLRSQFPRESIHERLKENPYEALSNGKYLDLSDTKPTADSLKRSLLIGSIIDLNSQIESSRTLKKAIKMGVAGGEIDLISGGPPCQSFSLAGMRQRSNERNSLPWAFAEFVRLMNPKMALLENVSGILRPFDEDGEKFYAWYEVAKAFVKEKYVPLCIHVNAKYCGAAQNRPRFIMLAFRADVALTIARSKGIEKPVKKALSDSLQFYKKAQKDPEIGFGELECYEVERDDDIFLSDLFRPLGTHKSGNAVTVKDAIDDFSGESEKSTYVDEINNSAFGRGLGSNQPLKNHDHRANSVPVRARFRLYQVMSGLEPATRKEIARFIKTGNRDAVSDNALTLLTSGKENWLVMPSKDNRSLVAFPKSGRERKLDALQAMMTKKQTQRALIADQPAPAALSIPDDACHYDESELRTLTVREMARIQSFPDWFEFRSKVTTGGQMRKFQVPQYTQVGNAVPPLLGKALGKVCKGFLSLVS